MNIAKVAERYHAGKTVAAKRLREMGMEIRPSGSLFGHLLTADRLREMYRQKGMRAQEIAEATGCNAGTVYNWLKKWDIPLKRVRRRGLRVQRND
jgi:DNA invertase Pin-like site-specific DNA recombinase